MNPHSFAGRLIKKNGASKNDFPQPQKFFADMNDFYNLIDAIPFVAVEDLEKYEMNRDILISIIRRIMKILDAAKIDIVAEIERIENEDPFNGLEEDLANRKSIKISGLE